MHNECPAQPDLLIFLGGWFRFLFGFLGLLSLLALVLLLSELSGELMAALVALAAQAQGAASRALGRGGFLKKKLQQHQTTAVADAVIGELDDARIAAVASGEFGGDVVEELLHHGLASE